MPITVGSNIASLLAQRRLGETSSRLGSVYERLSSGLRINGAGDDPAGLAVASGLNADARVYRQGVLNINNTVSLLSIADGALSELSNIVVRQQELAQQAANGSYSVAQRASMDAEFQALLEEYNRILNTTEFNGINLLNSGARTVVTQAGYSQISTRLGSELSNLVYPDGTLLSGQTYGGVGGFGAAVADFNGDGLDDLGIINNASDFVNILLSNGDGTFRRSASYFSGNAPYEASSTDFNNDGFADMLFSSNIDLRFVVMLGNGDGTLRAPQSVSYLPGATSGEVTYGDMNGDGRQDVIAITDPDRKVRVYLGAGDGTFLPGVSFDGSLSMQGVLTADLNNDGALDVYTADRGGRFTVLLGNGDGTLRAAVSYVSGASAVRATVGDLNGDGILDAVVAGYNADNLQVLLGNGNGTFRAPTLYESGNNPDDVELHDIDGDGYLDAVVTTGVDDRINIYFGNGNGTFRARISYGVPNGADILSSGDFNGDWVTDFVTDGAGATGPTVFLASTFEQAQQFGMRIDTQANALKSLETLDTVALVVANEQGNIGAQQSRLEIAGRNLDAMQVTTAAAAARITDTDVAADVAEMVRLQILQQATTAILAQANLQPRIALSLIEGASV